MENIIKLSWYMDILRNIVMIKLEIF